MNLPATTPAGRAAIEGLEAAVLSIPQVEMPTQHTLHAGVYYRTIRLPKDTVLVSAHIVVPTTLILCGDVTVSVGGEAWRVQGYHVLPAEADRKVAYLAHEDTMMTMAFATNAETVQEAEELFTDEASRLMSRRGINIVEITR